MINARPVHYPTLVVLLGWLLPQVALATEPVPAAGPALELRTLALCRNEFDHLSWFHPSYLQGQDLASVKALFAHRLRLYGPCKRVERESGEGWVFHYRTAALPLRLYLEGELISGVIFDRPRPHNDAFSAIDLELQALPGDKAALVERQDGKRLYSLAPEHPLAIGTSARLFVLQALVRSVEAGVLRWDGVTALRAEWLTVPGGLLGSWPAGTPVTLSTVALLMLGRDDPNAFDQLLAVVGREKVEPLAPGNEPFLAVGEVFRLHGAVAAKEAEVFAMMKPTQRRTYLPKLLAAPLDGRDLAGPPRDLLRLTWTATLPTLCKALRQVKGKTAVLVPGSSDVSAEVQGTSAGVYQHTALVEAPGGGLVCIAATWNRVEGELDGRLLGSLVARMSELVRRPRTGGGDGPVRRDPRTLP